MGASFWDSVVAKLLQSPCKVLQHTTAYYNLLQHTAMHSNILQQAAKHYHILKSTTMHYDALQRTTMYYPALYRTTTHYNAVQHTTSYCHIPQRITKHYKVQPRPTATPSFNTPHRTATYRTVLQRTTRCENKLQVLQHTAMHCNLLPGTTTHYIAPPCATKYYNELQHTAA